MTLVRESVPGIVCHKYKPFGPLIASIGFVQVFNNEKQIAIMPIKIVKPAHASVATQRGKLNSPLLIFFTLAENINIAHIT